jgi:hypothetical protein
MISKTKKEIRQKFLESFQTRTPKKNDIRKCITGRALLKDDMCTMKLHVYMLHNNEWNGEVLPTRTFDGCPITTIKY